MANGQDLIPVACRIAAETDKAVRLGVGLTGQEHLTWVPKSVCSIVGCAGEERVSIKEWWLNRNPLMQLDIHDAVNRLAQNQQKINRRLHAMQDEIDDADCPTFGWKANAKADDYWGSAEEYHDIELERAIEKGY